MRAGIEWEVLRLIEVPIVVVVRVPQVQPAIEVGVPGVQVHVQGVGETMFDVGLEVLPLSPTEDRCWGRDAHSEVATRHGEVLCGTPTLARQKTR